MNPWIDVPIDDYEKHMADPCVYQLQTLSAILKSKLANYQPYSLAILGICSGNGLEHIDQRITHEIYGIDINESYLRLCEERYRPALPGLHLYQLDIQSDEMPIPKVQMIACYLIFEYVNAGIVISKICKKVAVGGVVTTVVQNNNGISSISKTGVESLNKLAPIFNEVSIGKLDPEFNRCGFKKTEQGEIQLPNGKSFTVVDFKQVDQ